MYLPMIEQLAIKLGLQNWVLDLVIAWVPREVARGAEVASGLMLPILCYSFMPAYRKFCDGPDPDDLKLSKPKGTSSPHPLAPPDGLPHFVYFLQWRQPLSWTRRNPR